VPAGWDEAPAATPLAGKGAIKSMAKFLWPEVCNIKRGTKMKALSSWAALVLAICSALVIGLGLPPGAAAQGEAAQPTRSVLLLFSFEHHVPGYIMAEKGVREVLEGDPTAKTVFFTEHMDLARFPEESYRLGLADRYRQKYAHKKIDLVIAMHSAALDFLNQHGDQIFPGVPVVFGIVGKGELKTRQLKPNITGVADTVDFAGTLELALRLLPRTQRVVVISGGDELDKAFDRLVHQAYEPFGDRLEFKYLSGLPMPVLLGEVASLPERTIIIYSSIFRDGLGQAFVPVEGLRLISSVANAPVFGAWDTFLGQGMVGGNVASVEQDGLDMGQLALEILRGGPTTPIPEVRPGKNILMVDWRQLQRWGLSAAALPPGAVVRHREKGFWDLYKWESLGFIALLLLESVLIGLLLTQRARRLRAEEGLRLANEGLELRVRERTAELQGANQQLLREMNERRAVVEALLESEDKFRSLFNNASVGMFRTKLDGSRMLDVNDKFLAILGRTREEMLAAPSASHWADPRERREMVRRLEAEGQVTDFQCQMLNKQGEIRWCLTSLKVYRDQGVLEGSIQDITERKRNEEERELTSEVLHLVNAARNRDELLRSLLGRLNAWSGCQAVGIRLREGDDYPYFETSGFPPEFVRLENNLCARDEQGETIRDADGRAALDCMCGNIIQGRFDPDKSFFSNGGSFWSNCTTDLLATTTEAERQARTRNRCNAVGYESVALIPLRSGGETFGLLQFNDKRPGRFSAQKIALFERLAQRLADCLARMQAEEGKVALEAQLRQAHKMEAIGTLAGGIAHDFNNILAAILGFAEMAHEDAQSGRADPTDLMQIMVSAQRARDLVQQILTFSRKKEPALQPLDLNQVVRRTQEILGRTIPKMISIENHLADGLPAIQADPTQVEQVLLNLASNAQDAMPDGGRLVMETQHVILDQEYCRRHLEVLPGPYVLLMVSDSGAGVDQNDRERIFEPFFTTKEIGKGTGLGLSTVYGIVKNHGGHIHCHSEPGQGATFKLYWPVSREIVPASHSRERAAPDKALMGSETVLLVDDEDFLRQLGARALKSVGYQVVTAASGEEALEKFRRPGGRPDLVIMDLGMPGMGGHKAMKAMLELEPLAKVVIASGYSAQGRAKGALQDGAAGYVAKPFRRDDLLATVRRVLDTKVEVASRAGRDDAGGEVAKD
jgi:PAS domain S-box-containing protein